MSPPVGTRHEILNNPGLYIDLLALLFLVFMLWSSAKVRMSHIAVNCVRYGLLLWIAGGTFDVRMRSWFSRAGWATTAKICCASPGCCLPWWGLQNY